MSVKDERGKLDLRMYEGCSFQKRLQWKVGSPAVPRDLTATGFKMQVRSDITSTTPILELTTENNRIKIVDSQNGVFELVLDDADTVGLCTNHTDIRAVYDLVYYDAEEPGQGGVYPFLHGEFYITAAVTR